MRNVTGSACVLDQLVSPGSFQFSRGSGGLVPFSCRDKRRKSQRGNERSEEREKERLTTVTKGLRSMVGEMIEKERDARTEEERRREKESEEECVRGVPVLRGTVERYLCDCPSSGRPLFCYNHVSVRLRGHVYIGTSRLRTDTVNRSRM